MQITDFDRERKKNRCEEKTAIGSSLTTLCRDESIWRLALMWLLLLMLLIVVFVLELVVLFW